MYYTCNLTIYMGCACHLRAPQNERSPGPHAHAQMATHVEGMKVGETNDNIYYDT